VGKSGKRLHWQFCDPAGAEDEIASFREVRDQLQLRLREFAWALSA
jgi:protein-tyrosine-phosphatase